jgi:hypothetical protein
MVKRSRVRYPARILVLLKLEQKARIDEIVRLTNEPANEVVRRMIDREAPLFLEYASTTGRLLNGETV